MVYPLSLLTFVVCARNLAYQRHPQPARDIFADIPSEKASRESAFDEGADFTTVIGSQVMGMDHAFRHCIKPKKQHEIKILGEVSTRDSCMPQLLTIRQYLRRLCSGFQK